MSIYYIILLYYDIICGIWRFKINEYSFMEYDGRWVHNI